MPINCLENAVSYFNAKVFKFSKFNELYFYTF